jgi:hypothetical protein
MISANEENKTSGENLITRIIDINAETSIHIHHEEVKGETVYKEFIKG